MDVINYRVESNSCIEIVDSFNEELLPCKRACALLNCYAGKAMCKLFPILLILLTSGCASYSISALDKIDVTKGEYKVEKVNTIDEFPSNLLCFRSGKSNLIASLGVIPTRCVDLYLVTNSEENFGIVRVTRMQGIVPLFMTFSRKWKYGFGEDIETEISEYLVDEN